VPAWCWRDSLPAAHSPHADPLPGDRPMPTIKRTRTAVDAPRETVFRMYPEDLTVIMDKKHPRYDPRVELPLNEGLVVSINAQGVLEPLIAFKNGTSVEVVDGRQRHRASVEANKRRKVAGAERIRVPVILRKVADDGVAASLRNAANIHIADGLLARAKSVQHDIEVLGKSVDQCAEDRGVEAATVRQWLKLMDCTPAVQKAVDEGRIGFKAAVGKLAKLPREEQDAALKEALDASPKERAAREAGDGSGAPALKSGRPSLAIVRKLVRHDFRDADPFSVRERALLGWVNGDISTDDLVERIPALAPAVLGQVTG